jgi:hypothetical protein
MWKVPAAIAASVSAVVIAVGFAPTAFAATAVHPVQAPSPAPTAAPDPHSSMPGMDPNMPGMESTVPAMDPNMPGMDPAMPGMSQDGMAGMSDEEMAGMDHGATADDPPHTGGTGAESARPQAAVVGTFVMLNGGVLLTAGLMRRRAKLSARKPSRSSRPTK